MLVRVIVIGFASGNSSLLRFEYDYEHRFAEHEHDDFPHIAIFWWVKLSEINF